MGSVRAHVTDAISPLPLSVSGVIPAIVDQKRYYIGNVVGTTPGTTISETYQPAIVDLTIADVLRLISVQDLGIKSVSIGDMTTNNENLFEMAKMFEERGNNHLRSLAKGIKSYRSRG